MHTAREWLGGFIIFWMVKMMNMAKKETPPAETPTPEDVVLLREIRDALKGKA